jgi:hypothetical protein
MIAEWRAALEKLKREAKPKAWGAEPTDFAVVDGVVVTCCVENGRLVVGLSPDPDGSRIISDGISVGKLLLEVFGPCLGEFVVHYPKRGPTQLLAFGVPT